ncbi:hypothetical protein TKK_0010857 [Trichogramma kaykai]|uniref:Protein cueball n=1 Tax=Trichogramma kaykai TaxID=54128 RepID=A0ABD2WUT9_9HYME
MDRARPSRAFLSSLIIVACLLCSSSARSWDLAMTIGNRIEFFNYDGNVTGTVVIADAQRLVGMAYDDESRTMYLSDPVNLNFSLFSIDLSAETIKPQLLLSEKVQTPIFALAFDRPTRQLFMTTKNTILKMSLPANGLPGPFEVVLKFENVQPRDLAIDSCNRKIYWTNAHRSFPSIMSSNFDGSQARTLFEKDLYDPVAVLVDHSTSRLYWIDDEEGNFYFKIEYSNLDGSNRNLVKRVGKRHQPLHLAVSPKNFYWTDAMYSSMWQMEKDLNGGAIKEFKSFWDIDQASEPTTILARDNLGLSINCQAMKAESLNTAAALGTKTATTTTTTTSTAGAASSNNATPNKPKPTMQSFNNLTSSTEDQSPEVCFNGGNVGKRSHSCRCLPGFSGTRCEISVCHNYCLSGECSVNALGRPTCKCKDGFKGTHCQVDVCDNYCLNGGTCLVKDDQPTCRCKYSSGSRCEIAFDMAEVCSIYCMHKQLQIGSSDMSFCKCDELNHSFQDVLNLDVFGYKILWIAVAIFGCCMAVLVALLSFWVSRLRRRPRIKKRFVVTKPGSAPLTSRPGQLGTEQCEITIENCCNMNICETPCFEPKALPGRAISQRKEEKSNLIDNMESNGLGC